MTLTAMAPTLAPILSAPAAGLVPALAPHGDGRVALADAGPGGAVSYPALDRLVRAAAAGLVRRGVRPDDVVGLRVADAVSFAIGSLAVRAAGGVPLPVSPDATAAEASAHLASNGVRVLLTSAPLAAEAIGLADLSRVRQVVCFGHRALGAGDGAPYGTVPFESLLGYGTMRPLPRDGHDPALLCYPSGPGGRRPAWITHRALARDVRRLGGEARLRHGDVVIAAPPCGDGRRYTALLGAALARGATVIASASAGTGDLLAAARERTATAVIAPASAGLEAERPLRVLTVAS